MLSIVQKNIIIWALKLRKAYGEDVEAILKTYKNLSDKEKYEIFDTVTKEE